jgi:hypothetical protein
MHEKRNLTHNQQQPAQEVKPQPVAISSGQDLIHNCQLQNQPEKVNQAPLGNHIYCPMSN